MSAFFSRIIVIVLDSVGVGALRDASVYGDDGDNGDRLDQEGKDPVAGHDLDPDREAEPAAVSTRGGLRRATVQTRLPTKAELLGALDGLATGGDSELAVERDRLGLDGMQ